MPSSKSLPDPIALVVAETEPEPFLRALSRAERAASRGGANVLELRLDYLPDVRSMVTVLEKVARRPLRLTLIATCRRKSDGGKFDGSPSAQLAILEMAARAGCHWVDVDAPSLTAFPPQLRKTFLPGVGRIVSLHDFQRTPGNLAALVRRARALGADLAKIAALANFHCDATRLLSLPRRHGRGVITIPMGTIGIPGRVLAIREGSPLTFAAPEEGGAVAPGQLSFSQLRDLYRIRRIGRRTKVFGVAGFPALHSLSPVLHNTAFSRRGINAVYLPFEVKDLGEFMKCLRDYGITGLSVTAPHKERILQYLDEVDPIAGLIGAVNTLWVKKDGKLVGLNTDYAGVLRALERRTSLECSQVLIVGAGGSARACAFALATAGAFVSVTARRPAAARELARAVGGEAIDRRAVRRRSFDVIVNCTPVGQHPREKNSPLAVREINARVVLDLVYRPLHTRFLALARRRRARIVDGLEMLVEQGAAQFEIWTHRRAPVGEMNRAVRRALASLSNTRGLRVRGSRS